MKFERVFLIGLPGSGKTTYGKRLAEEFQVPFIDLDERIIVETNQSIANTFENKGEGYFREIERDQLRNVLGTNSQFVLATGGGTPCFHDNLEQMNASGLTVFLDTPIEEIEARLSSDSTRPLLQKYNLRELLEKRKSYYSKAQKVVTSFSELRDLLT